MHQEDHWYRDWARQLRARSDQAAEVAQSISLAVLRASEMRDKAVEAARTARARTAEARAKACNAGGMTGDGMWAAVPGRVEQRRAARGAEPPKKLQDSAFPRATAFRVWPFDK